MFETMKKSEIKELTDDLEKWIPRLKNEIKVREKLECLKSTSKWLDEQYDIYKYPEHYYNFTVFDKNVCILLKKYRYEFNGNYFKKIKMGTYTVFVQGYRLKESTKNIAFNSDTNSYGAFIKLDQAKKLFYKIIKEIIEEEFKKINDVSMFDLTDYTIKEIKEYTKHKIKTIKAYENGIILTEEKDL